MTQLVRIKTFPIALEGEIVKNFLAVNGIDCILKKEDAGSVQPLAYFASESAVGLFVKEKEVERALKLLNDKKENNTS